MDWHVGADAGSSEGGMVAFTSNLISQKSETLTELEWRSGNGLLL